MPQKPSRSPPRDELTLAVGLIWGHLNAQQPDDAWALARACLQLWPGERGLLLMSAYAAAELGEPVDMLALESKVDPDPARAAIEQAWIALVCRRAGLLPEFP